VVEATGDLVIGADGINSVVRAGLLSDGRPRYAGYTAWRAVARIPESLVPAGYCWETWGRGVRFGITRIGQGRVYWWAAKNAPEGGRDSDAKAALLETYRDWASPVPQIIEMTARDAIFRNDIIDRVPVHGWSRGRVTLLGDAAHPTTPNLGQGGCQAIEDGVVLAKKLIGTTDVGAALRSYEHSRYARAAAVTRASWRFGVAGHWENPLACWVRDTTASLIPRAVLLRQQQSLMHFSIE
jgi:2-polyprenyl-6-methoxyphenol hydroxylase-like FAD-dependent oxidoreductase